MPALEQHAIPHLSDSLLRTLNIRATPIIDMLEQLIRGSAAGTVWSAPKVVISPPDGRYIMATLAVTDDPPLLATKSLVLNERNSALGLPQINSLVTLLHGQTGVPLATIDGNWVTAVRTAGLSALAARYLANTESRSIGFVGTGVQARSHLALFADVFPLQRIKVFGRGQANINSLCSAARALGMHADIAGSAQAAITDVDLVVTSVTHTGVEGPFLRADEMSAGCHASIVDLGVPWHRDSFAVLDQLIIDDLVQEASLPNKLAEPNDVDGDLAGLVNGTSVGRQASDARTAFVFRGHALGDLALAALAWRMYREAEGEPE